MNDLLSLLARALPLVPVSAVVILALVAGRMVGRTAGGRTEHSSHGEFRRQLTHLVIALVAAVLVLVVLPVGPELRGQLLSLFGIVLSAAVALGSTTFVGNLLAGLMLKAVRNFHSGDFVHVGDQFGRVTSRGLLSTEIQTEARDLVTLPNLHLVTHPVKVVRASGTVVSAEVSLGYDVAHDQVEVLLESAAADVGLQDPFVLVMELGDFSVLYRVGGLLPKVKHLLTTRSQLRRAMINRLHRGGVEIVSPAFMNQRALDPREPVMAESGTFQPKHDEPTVEDLAFDKADEAQSLEQMEQAHARTREAIAALADQGDELDPETRSRRQELLTRQLARLEAAMAENRARAEGNE